MDENLALAGLVVVFFLGGFAAYQFAVELGFAAMAAAVSVLRFVGWVALVPVAALLPALIVLGVAVFVAATAARWLAVGLAAATAQRAGGGAGPVPVGRGRRRLA